MMPERGNTMKKVAILLLTALLLFACDFNTNKMDRITVSGPIVQQEMQLSDFTEIIFAGPFDVRLDQNGGSDLEVETYESLMQWVRADVLEDGTLLLYLEDTTEVHSFDIHFDEDEFEDFSRSAILSGSRLKWPENKKHLEVVLSVGDLDRIQVIGESNITLTQTLKAEDFKLEVAGAVHLEGDLEMEDLEIDLAGAGNLEMSGRTDRLEINCAGAGTIKAYDLIANDVDLEIAGVCNAQLYAIDRLDVEIAGMGTIRYKGDPSLSVDKAGIGSVKKADSNEKTSNDI